LVSEFIILMHFFLGAVRQETCERLAVVNVNLMRKAQRS